MKIGKLENTKLEQLILKKFSHTRAEVISPLAIGMDCARVRPNGGVVVLSTDPITAANERIGYLTVHVNCNDAATAGAEPVGLLVTVLAPPDTTEEQLGKVATDIAEAARKIGVDIIGGHTEITDSVTRIITSSTVVAQPVCELFGKILPGDDLVMTKHAGIEGTVIVATDHAHRITLTEAEHTEALALIDKISVVAEGICAAKLGAHVMHVVTEGGIFGAAWEMAYADKVGCVLDVTNIPILPVTQKICNSLSLNPYRLLSSGAMLIACENGQKMVDELKSAGIFASVIGQFTESTDIIQKSGQIIEPPTVDELYKL